MRQCIQYPKDHRSTTDRCKRLAGDSGRLGQRTGCIDHIVKNYRHFTLHISDYRHCLGPVGSVSPLIDNRQIGMQPFGKSPGPFDTARIRRNNHEIFIKMGSHIFKKHRCGKEIIHRNIKKSLNLTGVEIHGDNPVRAGNRH